MAQLSLKKIGAAFGSALLICGLAVGIAKAASSTTNTNQTVETEAVTVTYQDVINGSDLGDHNHMLATVGQLPANAAIVASHMKVVTPFADSNDPNMQPWGTFALQTDNTSVNEPLAVGDLTQTGIQTNADKSKNLVFDFANDLKLDVSIPQGQDNLTQLTSGEVILYVSYIPY